MIFDIDDDGELNLSEVMQMLQFVSHALPQLEEDPIENLEKHRYEIMGFLKTVSMSKLKEWVYESTFDLDLAL